LEREEAIKVLKEISQECGDSISINSISLTPTGDQNQKTAEKTERHFALHIQTELPLNENETIRRIIEKHGLKITKQPKFTVVECQTNTV
jgi:hypothetical protein